MAKMGLSLIWNRMNKFKTYKRSCKIELIGIIFSKVDNRTNLHNSTKTQLRSDPKWQPFIFQSELTQRTGISESVIDSKPVVTSTTAQSRSDYNAIMTLINSVTKEFLQKIQVAP